MHYKWQFDVVKYRKYAFSFSIAITILGILFLMIFGLNYGVDFKAGTSLDITAAQSIDKAKAEQIFHDAGYEATVTLGGDNNTRATTRLDRVLNTDEINTIINQFKQAYGDNIVHEENTVDPGIARELGLKAIYAVALSSIGIIIYVSIRFEWRFAISAVIALLHDAFIVISLFSILRLEVNLTFIAAILTIIGYSLNDTIVTFDRIRENMRFSKTKTFEDLSKLVNDSIWQTMTRSINTVFTVFIATILLLIMGSESIKLFSLAMTFGLISGVYSSTFIAAQLWLLLKRNSLKRASAAPVKN
ncbi:protein translocase subunit SecF [Paenibacillus sp. y28]|uniref:protein translocase subunit SecF n=1 Tax=Paenibacillus sp. y28 TaxID=3129110 RepID=UPI003016F0B8